MRTPIILCLLFLLAGWNISAQDSKFSDDKRVSRILSTAKRDVKKAIDKGYDEVAKDPSFREVNNILALALYIRSKNFSAFDKLYRKVESSSSSNYFKEYAEPIKAVAMATNRRIDYFCLARVPGFSSKLSRLRTLGLVTEEAYAKMKNLGPIEAYVTNVYNKYNGQSASPAEIMDAIITDYHKYEDIYDDYGYSLSTQFSKYMSNNDFAKGEKNARPIRAFINRYAEENNFLLRGDRRWFLSDIEEGKPPYEGKFMTSDLMKVYVPDEQAATEFIDAVEKKFRYFTNYFVARIKWRWINKPTTWRRHYEEELYFFMLENRGIDNFSIYGNSADFPNEIVSKYLSESMYVEVVPQDRDLGLLLSVRIPLRNCRPPDISKTQEFTNKTLNRRGSGQTFFGTGANKYGGRTFKPECDCNSLENIATYIADEFGVWPKSENVAAKPNFNGLTNCKTVPTLYYYNVGNVTGQAGSLFGDINDFFNGRSNLGGSDSDYTIPSNGKYVESVYKNQRAADKLVVYINFDDLLLVDNCEDSYSVTYSWKDNYGSEKSQSLRDPYNDSSFELSGSPNVPLTITVNWKPNCNASEMRSETVVINKIGEYTITLQDD